jgi:hypothetical protein
MSSSKSKKVLIHFGMDKTGSTSIRASLSKHLDNPKFHYVKLGMLNNASRSLAAGFKDNPETFPFFKHSGMSAEELKQHKVKAVEDLSVELQKAAGKTAIISAEAVSSFNEREFRGMCEGIAAGAKVIEAVGYIRRPKEYMESNFQQHIKGHFSSKLKPGRLLPEYRRRFEKFDKVLGPENVRFWLFDPQTFHGNCAVQDFCHRIGLGFPPENVIRINEGLSRPALSLLYAYRKYGPKIGAGVRLVKEDQLLVQHLRKLQGPKLRFHSSMVLPIIEKNTDDIAWMEERLGSSMLEDITAHDAEAIKCESDLLDFSSQSLQWLAEQLGLDFPSTSTQTVDVKQVALWMDALRHKLANSGLPSRKKRNKAKAATISVGNTAVSPTQGYGSMKLDELVLQVKQLEPDLAAIDDKYAVVLLRKVFEQIHKQIDDTKVGPVRVRGLGQFQVKMVEREKNDQKQSIKRVVFRPTKPKQSE